MWIGVDPGGKNAFGLATLDARGHYEAWCWSYAAEAIEHIKRLRLRPRPKSVGIDAPLWWSSGPAGSRNADEWIRKHYRKIPSGTVQSMNSLRGACLVQGVLFADQARQLFKDVQITEVNPKAVLLALDFKTNFKDRPEWDRFCKKYSIDGQYPNTDHERDAIVGAVAAREGFLRRWENDLSKDLGRHEQDPSAHWLGRVHYFWPHK